MSGAAGHDRNGRAVMRLQGFKTPDVEVERVIQRVLGFLSRAVATLVRDGESTCDVYFNVRRLNP